MRLAAFDSSILLPCGPQLLVICPASEPHESREISGLCLHDGEMLPPRTHLLLSVTIRPASEP